MTTRSTTSEYDFVSRYFAPWVGIPEDPGRNEMAEGGREEGRSGEKSDLYRFSDWIGAHGPGTFLGFEAGQDAAARQAVLGQRRRTRFACTLLQARQQISSFHSRN